MQGTVKLLLVAFLTLACSGEGDVPEHNGAARSGTDAGDSLPATSPPGVEDGHAGQVDHGHATAAPGEGQALLVIMQKLGANMAALTHGIMTEDTALVASSAAAIAEHADIAPAEVERIRSELGTDMGEFERLDAKVHEQSIALRDAARSNRFDTVLEQLYQVQRGCVECHTQFRQRLRTNPTD